MIISFSKNFIFIHAVKTGGTSVATALLPHLTNGDLACGYPESGFYPKHIWASALRESLPHFDNFFSFGFVRNPWDRLVSNFFWWQQVDKRGWNTERFNRLARGKSFEEYVLQGKWLVTSPCSDFFYDGPKCLVSEIGRFEDLNADFTRISGKLGISCPLGWENKSEHDDYRRYYTPAMVEMVAQRFRSDLDLFGYTF